MSDARTYIAFYFIIFIAELLTCNPWSLSLANTTQFSLKLCNGQANYRGHVPGSVHTDLIQAGLVKADPYFRNMERKLSWIPQSCWMYESAEFTIPGDKLTYAIHLRLLGVDSIANVNLNGVEVGKVLNAHRDHDFVLQKKSLKATRNILTIQFPSVLEYARSLAAVYPYKVPATQNYHVWAEPTNRNFVRKAGSDFGWDWGPAFVSMGISGDIQLYYEPVLKMDHLIVNYEFQNGELSKAAVNVSAVVTATELQNSPLFFEIYLNKVLKGKYQVPMTCSALDLCKLLVGSFSLDSVRLWWPRPYGSPYLYELEVHYGSQSIQKKIGFRKVELVQTPLNSYAYTDRRASESFYLKVNHLPVYITGASMVPLDSFRVRVLPSDYEYIVRIALESHINMLRVWGGGVYPSEDFLSLADREGLMVWQEVMLACALYPTDSAFLSEVDREVKQQMSRILSHPSVVVLGGNNEDELVLTWFSHSKGSRELYVGDYSKLMGQVVFPAVSWVIGSASIIQHNTLVWVDSSPSNGVISYSPYAKEWGNANNTNKGDVHFHNDDCDCEATLSYPAGKFISEFGFQSFPSFLSYERVTTEQDWSPSSPLLYFRQRHVHGNELMEKQMLRHFSLPMVCASSNSSSRRYFDMYLYLSQIQQANCYTAAISYWRSLRGVNNTKDVTRNNMGVMYGQLNDIWQGPSWSSVEYGGRWKPLHYAVKRVYKPLLFHIERVKDYLKRQEVTFHSYLVNEYPVDFKISLKYMLIRYDQAYKSLVREVRVNVPKKSSVKLDKLVLHADDLVKSYCTVTTCCLKAYAVRIDTAESAISNRLFEKRGASSQGTMSLTSELTLAAFQPLSSYHKVVLSSNKYSIIIRNLVKKSSHQIAFQLQVTVLAPHIFLELKNEPQSSGPYQYKQGVQTQYAGWFNNNNFFSEANTVHSLTYTSYIQPIDVDKWKSLLQVRSLQHVYNCQLSMQPTFLP